MIRSTRTHTSPTGLVNHGYVYHDRVGRDDDGEAVEAFYARRYPHSSPATWRARVDAGAVRRDGEIVRPGTRLRCGDRLAYHRSPWREPPVPWHVRVVHEDADLAVLDKPAGLPVTPDAYHLESTLVRWVRARYGPRATPVHRLDRGTSGLVLVARHEETARRLGAAFARREIVRAYLARVVGTDLPDALVVDARIGRIPYPPTRRLHAATPDGAEAHTHVRVIRRDPVRHVSLVEVVIETGRPHQIRIHLACAGAPLAGDPLYTIGGRPRPVRPGERPPLPGDGGYALRAHRLELSHPRTGEPLAFRTCRPGAHAL